jgi:hypothetical protein
VFVANDWWVVICDRGRCVVHYHPLVMDHATKPDTSDRQKCITTLRSEMALMRGSTNENDLKLVKSVEQKVFEKATSKVLAIASTTHRPALLVRLSQCQLTIVRMLRMTTFNKLQAVS